MDQIKTGALIRELRQKHGCHSTPMARWYGTARNTDFSIRMYDVLSSVKRVFGQDQGHFSDVM